MTELTTKEIAAKLQRSDLTASVLQSLVSAIHARRQILNQRLGVIEDPNGARREALQGADSDSLAKLNREAEAVDDEIGLLADLDTRAFRQHLAAVEREAIENGTRAHRRIAQVLGNAEQALAAYLDARQRLDDATAAIGGANDTRCALRVAAFGENVQAERLVIDDAAVDRVVAVMWPESLVREEQRRGARSGLRRKVCAPDPEQYGEPEPDLREQMRHNVFARRDS